MLKIQTLSSRWTERPGFVIDRPYGCPQYIFFHFTSSVKILLRGEMIQTPPNTSIIYNIGTPQYFISEQELVHSWIHFSCNPNRYITNYGLEFDRLYYPHNCGFIREIIHELEGECYSPNPYADLLIEMKMKELFLKLSRSRNQDMSDTMRQNMVDKFRYARCTILADLSHPWKLSEMAELVNFSESHFSLLYKKFYGMSPIDDLINCRIDSAKTALRYSDLSIHTISEMLGYNHVSHFIRQFKSRTGVTPEAYRSQQKP